MVELGLQLGASWMHMARHNNRMRTYCALRRERTTSLIWEIIAVNDRFSTSVSFVFCQPLFLNYIKHICRVLSPTGLNKN